MRRMSPVGPGTSAEPFRCDPRGLVLISPGGRAPFCAGTCGEPQWGTGMVLPEANRRRYSVGLIPNRERNRRLR
jgi:hypothetical protein